MCPSATIRKMTQAMLKEGVRELFFMEWEDYIAKENNKVEANEIAKEDEEDDDFGLKIAKPSEELQIITEKLFQGINNDKVENN